MKINYIKRAVACVALFVSFSSNAALIAYVNSGGSDIDFLNSMGHNVTIFNNPTNLNLSQLTGFDSVIASSNSTFSQPQNIGNVLKSFADIGGGVVLTEFVFQGQWRVEGSINDDGYNPFKYDPSSSGYLTSSSLGTIQQPNDALLNGINLSDVTASFAANVTLDAGAVAIADWSNGRRAFAYNVLGQSSVVGLNMFRFENGAEEQLLFNAVQRSLLGSDPSTTAKISEPTSLGMMLVGSLALLARRFTKK